MSGQRERAEAPDWWSQLYDEDAPDTGCSAAGDSLDDRYDSAARTVGAPGIVRQRPPDPPPRTPRRARPGPAKGTPPPAVAKGVPSVVRGATPPPVAPVGAATGGFLGDRPPTYEAEPTALPPADPDDLDSLTPDTVLDGARYGPLTVRAVSIRGDSARYRGRPRSDALLVARFGTGDAALLLVVVAGGDRAAPCADRAARDACHWIAGAVGRSHARLSEDIRAGRRGALKSGLGRLTARSMGRLRARAAELGLEPAEYTAELRCLLLPVDPRCRTRVFFGVGGGGLFRLRDGAWQDLEPGPGEPQTDEEADRSPESAAGVQPDGRPAAGLPAQQTRSAAVSPQADPDGRDGRGREGQARDGQDGNGRGGERRDGVGQSFQEEPGGLEAQSGAAGEALTTSGAVFRFRASQARPGDVLLLCGRGFAEPLREEQPLADHLATRWTTDQPPGLADFLVDVQTRLKGYADDRTAAAVWES